MTNEKTNTKTYFTINFFEGTISGTKTSFNRAGRGISPYYEELTEKMNAHPTFTLVIKEPKKKSDKPKRTYYGMDFKFMEKYIAIQKNSEQLMVEYKAVKKFAEDAHLSVYPTTKKWFLGEFDPDGEGFDMAKAKRKSSSLEWTTPFSTPRRKTMIPARQKRKTLFLPLNYQ